MGEINKRRRYGHGEVAPPPLGRRFAGDWDDESPAEGVRLVNLTPHVINIFGPSYPRSAPLVIEPSGQIARVAETREVISALEIIDPGDGQHRDLPMYRVTYGEISDLPEAVQGRVYIVSGMVAAAAGRADVFSPGELIRDDAGQPVGCYGLTAAS